MFILFYQLHVNQSHYTLRQVVLKRVSPNQWLIPVLVMTTNPETVIRDCKLFEDRLMSITINPKFNSAVKNNATSNPSVIEDQ